MSQFHSLMMARAPVYTVTFHYGDIPAQRVMKNKLAVKPADPYKENHDFTGWFADGVLFDFSTPVTGDLALTAGWSLTTHVVTFDANGGNVVTSQTVVHGSRASPVVPDRTYYTFNGWTLKGVAFDLNTPVTEDITLVANWEKTLYTQSGTAKVTVLAKGSGNLPDTLYGVVVTFSMPFTEVVSASLNGRAIPYSYDKYDSLTYLNVAGFRQQTGQNYWYYDNSAENYVNDSAGTTSGNMSWTITGYYA